MYISFLPLFNPSTIIEYSIPKKSIVSIKIFDVLGKEIRTLFHGERKTGNYQIQFDSNNMSSGIYFYSLVAGDFVDTKKMILLK